MSRIAIYSLIGFFVASVGKADRLSLMRCSNSAISANIVSMFIIFSPFEKPLIGCCDGLDGDIISP